MKSRVEYVAEQHRTDDLREVMNGSKVDSRAASQLENSLWQGRMDSPCEGMLEGFRLANYLLLVENAGCMFRKGKDQVSSELAGSFERLRSSADCW